MGGTNYVLSVLYAVGSVSIRVSFNLDNMRLMFLSSFCSRTETQNVSEVYSGAGIQGSSRCR